jgi:hypothetical protein
MVAYSQWNIPFPSLDLSATDFPADFWVLKMRNYSLFLLGTSANKQA